MTMTSFDSRDMLPRRLLLHLSLNSFHSHPLTYSKISVLRPHNKQSVVTSLLGPSLIFTILLDDHLPLPAHNMNDYKEKLHEGEAAYHFSKPSILLFSSVPSVRYERWLKCSLRGIHFVRRRLRCLITTPRYYKFFLNLKFLMG